MSNRRPGVVRRILNGAGSFLSNLASGSRVLRASSFELQFPILTPLRVIYNKIVACSNAKESYRLLKEVDPELSGAVDRISKMVRSSYQGFGVRPGAVLETSEKELMEALKEFEDEFRIRDHFYAIADTMLTYGDSVYHIAYEDDVGLVELRSLPMEYITAIATQDQKGVMNAQIFEANFYILNEGSSDAAAKEAVWAENEILHFALNNISSTVHDLKGRYTYGVWSTSPIESLRAKLLWKLALLINDIMLRQHLVPRQHHKVNLEAFDPRFFPGATVEERYENARAAAASYLDDYKSTVATPLKEVDKSVITDTETEITYLEPKNVTYVSPNELVEQIDRSIWAAIGPVETATTGRGARTYASELVVSSFATMCATIISDIIRISMIEVAKEHIRRKYGGQFDKDLDKIDIKIQFVLGIERGEQVRQFAIMTATDAVTINEARDVIGLGPLREEDKADILRRQIERGRGGQFDRTIADIISDYTRRKEDDNEPVTPQSRRDRQIT